MLEDKDTEHSLKNEWNDVEDALSLLEKMQCQRDKMIVNAITLVPTTSETPLGK